METQITLDNQNNFEKKEQSQKHHISWFQIILQSYSNQNSMILAKNIYIDQWNRIKTQEITPHICDWLIFGKGSKITFSKCVEKIENYMHKNETGSLYQYY